MLRDVSFGQYYPVSSAIHKLDPRTKILLLIAYIVAVFLAQNFIALSFCVAFLLVAIILSKVPPLTVLKSMKGIIVLVVFTAIINVCFYSAKDGDTKLFWVIYKEGLISALFLSVRLIALVMGSSVLTLTTTAVGICDGLESLLKPLNKIKFPVHELALIMSIALRFIPTLTDETDRIICAQKARGGDFESGNVIKRIKALIPVLIPLLVSAFRRADELGDAMDARCYSGNGKRTKYKKLKFSLCDLIATALTAVFIFAVVFISKTVV